MARSVYQMAGDEPAILSHHPRHDTGDMATGPPWMADVVELDLLEACDEADDEFFYSLMLRPPPPCLRKVSATSAGIGRFDQYYPSLSRITEITEITERDHAA